MGLEFDDQVNIGELSDEKLEEYFRNLSTAGKRQMLNELHIIRWKQATSRMDDRNTKRAIKRRPLFLTLMSTFGCILLVGFLPIPGFGYLFVLGLFGLIITGRLVGDGQFMWIANSILFWIERKVKARRNTKRQKRSLDHE